jgi:hypothetical protein
VGLILTGPTEPIWSQWESDILDYLCAWMVA